MNLAQSLHSRQLPTCKKACREQFQPMFIGLSLHSLHLKKEKERTVIFSTTPGSFPVRELPFQNPVGTVGTVGTVAQVSRYQYVASPDIAPRRFRMSGVVGTGTGNEGNCTLEVR